MSASVGTVLGDYRLEAVLGASPAAVVYRAAHVRLGTPATVKVLAPVAGEDEQGRERFLRRVTATAGIDHPSVLPILDAGVHEDEPYIVMRYVAGGDLKALVARTGALEPALAMTILQPVAEALDAAHASGVVHGGVKPSNVLLRWSRDGTVQQVYLSDFGMAERAPSSEGLSSVGPLVDRFDYLAPEQVEDGEVGPPADVYALGCVVFHALTGRAPFGGRFGGAVLQGRGAEGVERPSAVRGGLPAAVDEPVLRAMEEDPGRRFAGAGDLMRAVGMALADSGARAAERTVAPAAPVEDPVIRAPSVPPVRALSERPLVAEPDRTLDSPSVAQAHRAVDSPLVTEADRPAEPEPEPEPQAARQPEPEPEPEPAPPAPLTAEPSAAVAAAAADAAEPPRRRRRLLTVTIPVIVCTLLAGVVGFVVASGGGDDDGGSGATTATEAAAGGTGGADTLRAITDRRLSEMRCTVSDAGAGGEVAGTAGCTAEGGAAGQPQRVNLTLLASREALDTFFRRSRALAAGGAGAGTAGCPTGRWTSAGGGAGRVFCAGDTPRVVWTVDDALVLADASGAQRAELVTWWEQQRDLRPEGRQG